MNKLIFSNIQPNSKESKIWLNVNGQLKTYNSYKQRWGILISNNNKPEIPEDPIIPDEPEVPPTPVNPWEGIANGVYAVSADYQPVDYTIADSSCIGVALITDNQRIMIPKTDVTDGTNNTFYWSKNLYGKDVAGITDITESSAAKTDFNGKVNTDAIIASYSQHSVNMDSRDVCKVLETYTEGGFTDWYIPAAGQLYEMYNKKSDINAALAKIGGTAIKSYEFWSSSEYNASSAWLMDFAFGSVNVAGKGLNYYWVCFVRDI